MSAADYLHPEYREGAYFQLGRLRAKLEEAKIRARRDQNRAERAERLLEALGGTLGVDLDVLERISQAEASYFKEVRDELLKALEAWAEDQKIPVCLHCGSSRADWIESEGAWKCQDCGTIEDSTGEGRAKNEFCSERQTKGVNR